MHTVWCCCISPSSGLETDRAHPYMPCSSVQTVHVIAFLGGDVHVVVRRVLNCLARKQSLTSQHQISGLTLYCLTLQHKVVVRPFLSYRQLKTCMFISLLRSVNCTVSQVYIRPLVVKNTLWV